MMWRSRRARGYVYDTVDDYDDDDDNDDDDADDDDNVDDDIYDDERTMMMIIKIIFMILAIIVIPSLFSNISSFYWSSFPSFETNSYGLTKANYR